jgi:hypothetical protein
VVARSQLIVDGVGIAFHVFNLELWVVAVGVEGKDVVAIFGSLLDVGIEENDSNRTPESSVEFKNEVC